MPALRREEMASAAEILGVAHAWLGFEDSGLPRGRPASWELPEGCFGALDPDEQETAALVAVVREFRPHVMTTYDENGGYPHPDHIRATWSRSRRSRRPATPTPTRTRASRGSR